jgi:hypothetical protein
MSRKNTEEEKNEGQGDPGIPDNSEGQGDPGTPDNSEGQGDSGSSENSGGQEDSKPPENPGLFTVEDHAKRLALPASVFAAVTQTQHWAAGKKVTAEVFEKAVETFLKAPIGGNKTPKGEQ